MTEEELQQREVLALISWLQTFDQFPFSVVDGTDGENVKERCSIVLESLENVKISSAVVKVAEEVCDIKTIDVGENPTADDIWRAMLHVTATKSRFEIYSTPSNVKSDSEIPHVVLSNLLDFAVTSPDLDERRKYIERIMSLSKSIQKILMSLIERMKRTLPRKPKTPGPPFNTNVRSSKGLCGPKEPVEGPDAPIPDPSSIVDPIMKKCREVTMGKEDDFEEDNSENTPQQENPQSLRGYTTPKRERNVHGIPQSEPRATIKDSLIVPSPPRSEQKPSCRYPSRERSRPDDLQASNNKPKQPEGIYLTQKEKRRCHKGFSSPSRDRQRKQKGFSSPSKRHSIGSVMGLPLPFRERKVQTQRASYGTIANRSTSIGTPNKKEVPPPPPPPPCATQQINSEQKMPTSSTPSDELEIDNHFSLPMTDTTLSTMTTDSSHGTSTEIAQKLSGQADNQLAKQKKSIMDKKRLSEGCLTPPRRPVLAENHSSSRPKTPEMSLAMYERDVDFRMMLSPDDSMLQSPMQVDDFVKELRAKNKSLESILQSYQKRERELSQKMESTESKLRKEMMKLESRALGREDELRSNYENEVARLKKELRMEKEKHKESKRAKEELANANDELDLMQHTHEKLLEATEKIRKYKERLDSMNDYKEALQREQDAHSQSVEECVRLQNELNALQPLKRQLEDYKTRALETEVQLAECKDSLSRLERERAELDGARDDVMKEAQAQRAQAEELRKFIRLEESEGAVPGIGEGVSELNPELHEELIKLRNENERLRAFADERTDDSVQRLQENLEDSNLRQERFKEEYLKSKNKLETTESLLNEAKQKLAELESDIERKDQKAEEYESRLGVLENHYTDCLEDLEGLQEQIEITEEQKAMVEADLAEWKQMADKLESELANRSSDLESTRTELRETEEMKMQVQADLDEWKLMADRLDTELQRRANELDATRQTLGATEEEKTQVEGNLAEWKQMAEKLEAELMRKTQELDETGKKLASVEEEKALKENEIQELRQVSDKLESELKSRTAELDETKKQLVETEEVLRDSGERHEELLNRIDVYEKKLIEAEEENEETSNQLDDTQRSLKEAKHALEESKNKESSLNDECQKLKEVSEQLLKQLKEEKKAKKAIMDESHKSLEATRAVLNSKAKKDLEELQANMNQLLNDERKAYRLKAEKASIDFKKLEEKHQKRLQEVQDESAAALKAAEEDAQQRYANLEESMKDEIDTVKKQEETKRNQLIKTGETMIEEAKEKAKEMIQELRDEKDELAQVLEETTGLYQQQTNKSHSLKKKLEYATHQINNLENNLDDLRDEKKKLEREKAKLEEESERYRRQLGGCYGADGQLQSQVDRLTKELSDAQNESRELKRKLAARGSSEDMSFDADQSIQIGYSSGAVNVSAMAQVRASYEEAIANLNDEKRELIMKNSAAITKVQKAEQITWEREKENAKLKEELTSLNLKLQRAELIVDSSGGNVDTSFYSLGRDPSFIAHDISFAVENSQNGENRSQCQNQSQTDQGFEDLDISSRAGESSNGETEKVLTPSKKFENSSNFFSERAGDSTTVPKSPYQLNLNEISRKSSERRPDEEHRSIVDYTQTPASPAGSDVGTECNQS